MWIKYIFIVALVLFYIAGVGIWASVCDEIGIEKTDPFRYIFPTLWPVIIVALWYSMAIEWFAGSKIKDEPEEKEDNEMLDRETMFKTHVENVCLLKSDQEGIDINFYISPLSEKEAKVGLTLTGNGWKKIGAIIMPTVGSTITSGNMLLNYIDQLIAEHESGVNDDVDTEVSDSSNG